MCEISSFHLSNLCLQTTEAKSLLTARFHLSPSLEVVFVVVVFCLLFFNFFTGIGVEIALFRHENCGIDIFPDKNLSDLEYLDGIVLMSEDPSGLMGFSLSAER